jgi:hypothetical protein
MIHPAVADLQWDRMTDPIVGGKPDPTPAPEIDLDADLPNLETPQTMTISAAKAHKETFLALSAQAAFMEKMGQLSLTSEVQDRAYKLAASLRKRIQSVPGRVAPQVVALAKAGKDREVESVIYKELMIALQEEADDARSDHQQSTPGP